MWTPRGWCWHLSCVPQTKHLTETDYSFRSKGPRATSSLVSVACVCLVTQSSLTLCDPTDSSPSGFSIHGDSPGKNAEMGCHFLLQRIFPIQGSNPGQTHCRQVLHHLGHQGMSSPKLEGFWGGASGKEPTCQCRRYKKQGFNPWVRKIFWRRKWT